MAITGPNRKESDHVIYSEHVICEGFVFKPSHVDAFYHQALNEAAGVTTVKFKSYSQDVKDPEMKLFNYLVNRFSPTLPDEPC